MDELPRRLGGAEVRGEYVMKSTRSEETRISVLDDYLVDPKISMLAKSLTRNGKDCAIPIHGSISLRIEQASARAIAPKRDRARPHCWRRWLQSLWRGGPLRLSQAKVRSTTQRRVRTREPAESDRLTITIHDRPCPASAEASLSPHSRHRQRHG